MYGLLTASTPGCVAFSLPVQRWNLTSRVRRVFPASPQPALRAADKERRFRARAASGPRHTLRPRDGLRHGRTDYQASLGLRYAMAGERFGAALGFQQKNKAAIPCRPQCLDGPTLNAPDCVADQDPRDDRADARQSPRPPRCPARIRLGTAPQDAFWPSPHPRIRWTVASPGRATRARPTRPPPSRAPKCQTRC